MRYWGVVAVLIGALGTTGLVAAYDGEGEHQGDMPAAARAIKDKYQARREQLHNECKQKMMALEQEEHSEMLAVMKTEHDQHVQEMEAKYQQHLQDMNKHWEEHMQDKQQKHEEHRQGTNQEDWRIRPPKSR